MLCLWGRKSKVMVIHFMKSAILMSPAHKSCRSVGSNVLSPCSHHSAGASPVSQTGPVPSTAPPSCAWWCSGCSETPSPAPAAVCRCTPPCTCPLCESSLLICKKKNQNFARGTLEGTLDFVDVHINENSASESHAVWAMITQQTNLKPSGATFKFRRHLKPHQLY